MIQSTPFVDLVKWVAFDCLKLCAGTVITKLHVSWDGPDECIFIDLLGALLACPSLAELDISHDLCGEIDQVRDIVLASRADARWPAVRTFRLCSSQGTASLRFLLLIFAPTLVELFVIITGGGPDTGGNNEIRWSPVYPVLQRATVSDFAPSRIIYAFSSSRFPSLRLFVCDALSVWGGDAVDGLGRWLQTMAAAFAASTPPLHIKILLGGAQDPLRFEAAVPTGVSNSLRVTIERIEWRSIDANRHKIANIFLPPDDFAKSDLPLGQAQRDINESLDAIRDITSFATATGDRFQLAKIAQALQECEFIRYQMNMDWSTSPNARYPF